MARSCLRAHGPTEFERRSRCVAALALAPALAACVAYTPSPVDPGRVLADLENRRWPELERADRADTNSPRPDQLAAFAITHNPSLQAVRAQVGVAQALLVEAGLLSDPELGWDGMDALAAQVVDGTTSTVDYVSGFGLSIPLPRPGELSARKGVARWRVEEACRRITEVEWTLARDVHLACEDVLEAERLVAQNEDLAQLAEATRDTFARAKDAGAATAIQANLAAGDLLAIRARHVRLEARLRDARHGLNALIGLPPRTVVPVSSAPALDADEADATAADAERLVERSLSLRPDLAVLLAGYEAAEEEVRLEVARQFPRVAVGTGIWVVPGLFTRFNRPAIETAVARREALRGEVSARVHEVRREIHDAYAALDESRREVRFLESELLPNAEESLRLARGALDAGEVTLIEILALQRALVDARTQTTEARAELQRGRWRLLAASGTLLAGADARAVRGDDPENEAP